MVRDPASLADRHVTDIARLTAALAERYILGR